MEQKELKVLFTGDRNFRPEYMKCLKEVFRELKTHSGIVSIIVGDCPSGVDPIVSHLAQVNHMPCHVERAEWERYRPVHGKGNPAGIIRNGVMVAMRPDICIAVHSEYSVSKGTKDCASRAIKAGITTVLLPNDLGFDLDNYIGVK
jgi:hypothetical protein